MTTLKQAPRKAPKVKNPEYDFKWCPGCGDFGVRRAVEMAIRERALRDEAPLTETVIVAGIGCSGNLVHLVEGEQPFGIHGVHGRTLPQAFGIKMGRPELSVLVVAGDGDFLSIGGEHIVPQAQRNLDVCAVIMDNGVYGLTKGQSSPTTDFGVKTSSTPYGKIEGSVDPLDLYLTAGVSFIASGFSGKPKDLASLIVQGMDHKGFSIVHIQSPCTEYNDTYELLKGNAKQGIKPALWPLPDDYDASNKRSAYEAIHEPGIPVGVLYKDPDSVPMQDRQDDIRGKARQRPLSKILDGFRV